MSVRTMRGMTTHGFDKDYWERHWRDRGAGSMGGHPPNPYLAREIGGLTPGTALDAGCGGGAEAIWLASHGWEVTAADISSEVLALAADRATMSTAASGAAERVRWVEADLSVWSPDTRLDLVMTHYAHPAMPQLEFYDRIAGWVAPGGTLLIVGHLHVAGSGHGHHPRRRRRSPPRPSPRAWTTRSGRSSPPRSTCVRAPATAAPSTTSSCAQPAAGDHRVASGARPRGSGGRCRCWRSTLPGSHPHPWRTGSIMW